MYVQAVPGSSLGTEGPISPLIVQTFLFPLQAELKKWAEKDASQQRTLPGMMTLLQAGERPEAAQPEVNKAVHLLLEEPKENEMPYICCMEVLLSLLTRTFKLRA